MMAGSNVFGRPVRGLPVVVAFTGRNMAQIAINIKENEWTELYVSGPLVQTAMHDQLFQFAGNLIDAVVGRGQVAKVYQMNKENNHD